MNDNPMFAKFDQVLGKTTPTTSAPPVQTRAAEIRALGQTSAATAPPKEPTALDNVGNAVGSAIHGIGSVTGANAIGESLGTAAVNIGKLAHGQQPDTPVNVPKAIGGYLQAGSAVAGLGAAAPATIGGAALAGATVGGAQGTGSALEHGASLPQALGQGAIGAAVGGVTAGAVSGLGHLIGQAGDKIMTSVIKPVKADIADGFNLQTIKDYDLGGSLNTSLDKTQSALSDLTSQLHSKLAATDTKVNITDVVNQTVKELTDESKLKGFGANTKIANLLGQLKEEANIVAENGTLSIPDAQVVKQAAGNFGAWQFGKVDPDSKASEIVYNTFYNKLKTAIEQNSPEGVKGINKELSRLIPVQNAILRRLPVAERSNLISLNEMIGLVGSAMNPIALGPTLLNLVSRSGAAGSLLSKFGPAAGRSLAVPAALGTSAIGSQATQESDTGQ